MNQRDNRQFLEVYQNNRFHHQLSYYQKVYQEFNHAQKEAIIGNIILISLTGVAGIIASSLTMSWLKLIFLLLAAILPVCSSALAAYSALYGFDHQTKLYQDTMNNLLHARASLPKPNQNLSEAEFTEQINTYVQQVEQVLQVEQGQWGQLVKQTQPSEK